MTTATHTGLLRAICERPRDIDLRLIFADWLDESGQEARAEFIRVQCKLAALRRVLQACTDITANWCPVCGDCCCPDPEYERCHPTCPLHSPLSDHGEWDEATERERELLFCHWAEWTPRLKSDASWEVILSPSWQFSGHAACLFRRGFVEEAHCSCQDWLDHGPDLVSEQPITEVRLTDREPRCQYAREVHWGRNETTADPFAGGHACLIPHAWFAFLKRTRSPDSGFYGSATAEVAIADLSQAAVAWARDKAGLPTLQ